MLKTASRMFAYVGRIICTLLVSCSVARAGEAPLDMGLGQYAHRAWTIGGGVVNASIHALAQTPDGYLWLGTQLGLWRFDGVRTVLWRAPDGRALPGKWIQSLATAHDGTLWIGTDAGLASWRAGRLTEYPALAGLDVLALLVDREGTVWAGTESRATSTGKLCAIRAQAVHCYGEDASLGARIYCLYEDIGGALWLASSSGVWRWRPGKPKLYPMLDSVTGYFQSLTSGPDGGVLVSAHDGLREIVGGEVRTFPLPDVLPQVPPPWVLTDRDGALWLGTIGRGLRYVHGGRMYTFGKPDGLTGDQVSKIFADSEGNIWVATRSGLDEFWKIAAARVLGEPNLSDGNVTSNLTDIGGGVWFAMQAGLYRWKDGKMTVYRRHASNSEKREGLVATTATREIIAKGLPVDTSGSLYQDRHGRIWLGSPAGLGYLQNDRFKTFPAVPGGELTCITEDDQENLWIANRMLGLFRVSPDGQVKRFDWSELGIAETWSIVFDPTRHGLWLGSLLGEIAFFKDGKVQASFAENAPGKRGVRDLRVGPDGTLWVAAENGLTILRHGHLATLNSQNGLPCDIVHATIEDNAGSVWIYMACGLVRVARSDLDAWSRGTLGGQAMQTLVLGSFDGVKSSNVWHFSPKVAKSPDGRLWLASATGPMTVDPRNLPHNALPPPVHIEQVVADRKAYDTSLSVRLLPRVRDLEIDYTAMSMVVPEKNLFRYKLEGLDSDWQDAGNRRQAFFTNLAPGNYRFRVIASNNSGVWNNEGAALAFSVAPAYWQTRWFWALCVAAFAALLTALYRMRLSQVARAAAHEQEIEHRHRELQMELAHANRLAAVGQLTASITHEIRQPITTVLGSGYAARRWLERPDIQEALQAIDHIIKAATKAGDIITGLRALVKKAPARIESFDMNQAIREVIVITRGEAAKNNVSVAMELAEELSSIQGDRVQLQQVILNLVINAIEAMSGIPDGPRDLLIRTAKSEPDSVTITVFDTGPGLDPEHAMRAFDAFYTTKPQGLGMGLSICRSIAEAHGGKLSLSANVPRGAVFQLTVPTRAGTAEGSQ